MLLSAELERLAGELDEQQLACAASAREADARALQLQSAASHAAQRRAALEAQATEYAGRLRPAESEVTETLEALRSARATCSQQRLVLQSEKEQGDLNLKRIRGLVSQMVDSCQRSQLLLACGGGGAEQVFFQVANEALRYESWRLRERLSLRRRGRSARAAAGAESAACRLVRARRGRSGHKDRRAPRGSVSDAAALPRAASLPEPAPADADAPLPATPSCLQIEDTSDDMESAALAQIAEVAARIGASDRECSADEGPLDAEVRHKMALISQAQLMISQAEAEKGALHRQHVELSREVQSLATRSAALQAECADEKAELEGEIADVIKTRQFVFQQLFSSENQDPIQDCQVGDWSATPCSKACTEPSDSAGTQVLTRPVILQPDQSSLQGQLGAACPATRKVRECNAAPCPVDCVMSQWSGWAGCSRECGGGQQYRTRAPLQLGVHGGLVCGASSQSQACNLQTCKKDCVLGEWSAWSPCSRRCLWTNASAPGHAQRSRSVISEALNGGSCSEDRSQFRECNAFVCPANLAELRCTADQDIAFLLDGSGSARPPEANAAADQTFSQQKEFVRSVIANSDLSGTSLSGPSAPHGVRFGLLAFGGAERARLLAPLSGDSQALLAALGAATWPSGKTPLGQALAAAAQLFEASGTRHGSAVVLSDGLFPQRAATATAARRLKDTGVRVLVLLVQRDGTTAATAADQYVCDLASAPCSDNVLRVNRWEHLLTQLGRFLAAICPVAFS